MKEIMRRVIFKELNYFSRMEVEYSCKDSLKFIQSQQQQLRQKLGKNNQQQKN
jgi:hypothetical protein